MSINHFRRMASTLALLMLITVSLVNAAPNAPLMMPQGAQAPQDPYNLTPAQKDKLKVIKTTIQQQVDTVQGTASLSRNDKANKIVALLDSLDRQERSILDPMQAKLFDQDRAKQSAADPLHLTVLQKVQMHLIQSDMARQAKVIALNSHMSVDARAASLEKIMTANKNAEKALLSPAQLKAVNANENSRQAKDPLHLTIRQQIKRDIIFQDAMRQAGAIYENKTLTKPQIQAKVAALGKSMQKDQDAVLTPGQRAEEAKQIAQHKPNQ